jgi:hypothetical protein
MLIHTSDRLPHRKKLDLLQAPCYTGGVFSEETSHFRGRKPR